MKRILVLLKLFDTYIEEFSLETCRWDIDAHKSGSARRAFEKLLPDTLCYTFEASFFHDLGSGFHKTDSASSSAADPSHASGSAASRKHGNPPGAGAKHFQPVCAVNTERSYVRMGEQLGRALAQYYKRFEPTI